MFELINLFLFIANLSIDLLFHRVHVVFAVRIVVALVNVRGQVDATHLLLVVLGLVEYLVEEAYVRVVGEGIARQLVHLLNGQLAILSDYFDVQIVLETIENALVHFIPIAQLDVEFINFKHIIETVLQEFLENGHVRFGDGSDFMVSDLKEVIDFTFQASYQ